MPKVKDLINKLQQFNPELNVCLNDLACDDPLDLILDCIFEATTKNNCLQDKDSWEDPDNQEVGPFVADTLVISFD